MALSPATFWAMSWMTVKVVTTRNGLALLGRLRETGKHRQAKLPATAQEKLQNRATQFAVKPRSSSVWNYSPLGTNIIVQLQIIRK